MNKFFRATCLSILATAATSAGFLACSSTDNTNADGGTTGDGGPAGDGNPANNDGGGGEGGGDGASGSRNVGSVHLTQGNVSGNYFVSASASFLRNLTSTGTPPACPAMVSVQMGACLASVLCVPAAVDGGMPTVPSTLNAGTITISGGTGPAGAAGLSLPWGPVTMGPYMFNGYKNVSGNAQFFVGGDMLTFTGAGGADVPAFTQMLTAPTDVTVTAPAAPDTLDRTMDIAATWTGGAAGKVYFTYETLSSAYSSIVTCNFNAADGMGTIPAALLAHLEKGGDPGISGVYSIGVTNDVSATVSDIPTTFTVQGGGTAGALTVSN